MSKKKIATARIRNPTTKRFIALAKAWEELSIPFEVVIISLLPNGVTVSATPRFRDLRTGWFISPDDALKLPASCLALEAIPSAGYGLGRSPKRRTILRQVKSETEAIVSPTVDTQQRDRQRLLDALIIFSNWTALPFAGRTNGGNFTITDIQQRDRQRLLGTSTIFSNWTGIPITELFSGGNFTIGDTPQTADTWQRTKQRFLDASTIFSNCTALPFAELFSGESLTTPDNLIIGGDYTPSDMISSGPVILSDPNNPPKLLIDRLLSVGAFLSSMAVAIVSIHTGLDPMTIIWLISQTSQVMQPTTRKWMGDKLCSGWNWIRNGLRSIWHWGIDKVSSSEPQLLALKR